MLKNGFIHGPLRLGARDQQIQNRLGLAMVKQVTTIELVSIFHSFWADLDGFAKIGLGSVISKFSERLSIADIVFTPTFSLRGQLEHALEVVIESLFVPQASEQ